MPQMVLLKIVKNSDDIVRKDLKILTTYLEYEFVTFVQLKRT